MKAFVTGVAGFIGFHTVRALLAQGVEVLGVDNLNPYYDLRLKRARLALLKRTSGFSFYRTDLTNRDEIGSIVSANKDIALIVHLAAQAGVRHSLVDPYCYIDSNVTGHLVILEAARRLPNLRHLVYASSSSVYGLNKDLPFKETDRTDSPSSVYAATKRSAELLSFCYSHIHGIPQTGLRFFTVYGPWGRPDMAYYKFAEAIVTGQPIVLYNKGVLRRDFTYIDDIVTGVLSIVHRPPDNGASRILNLGNNRHEYVRDLLTILQRELGREAIVQDAARPMTDVEDTWACIDSVASLSGWRPTTPIEVGVPRFVKWFVEFRSRPHAVDEASEPGAEPSNG